MEENQKGKRERVTFRGIPLTYQRGVEFWSKEPPRYYFLNQEALEWSARTGRPVWEYLWRSTDTP